MSMSDKIALITGANRGIGFETARQLGALNIEVIITSRDENKGREAVEKLKNEGLNVHCLALEASNLESVGKLKNDVLERFGKLDILINNAGVYLDENKRILQIAPEIFETTLHTNLFGPFYLSQAFLPVMEQNGYGRIVNISSGYGALNELDSTGTASYKLSKNALNALTRLLAATVNGRSVKVNVADPGWVKTAMGGPSAPRTPEVAAAGIVWLATLPEDGPNGKFFYDKEITEW